MKAKNSSSIPWILEDSPWNPDPKEIKKYVGFVYEIKNLVTGQKYIGKKNFWSRRKLKPENKRRTTIESDWRNYWSSSDVLKSEVKTRGEECFLRTILTLCTKQGELTYGEVSAQMKADVLTARLPSGEFEYLNENISARWYRQKMAIDCSTPISDEVQKQSDFEE